MVAFVQATRAVLMLGLTLVLTVAMGTLGAGVAVAASQGLIAVLTSLGLWRILVGDRHRTGVSLEEVSGR